MFGFTFDNDKTDNGPVNPVDTYGGSGSPFATQELPREGRDATAKYDSMPMPPAPVRPPKKSHFARNAVVCGIGLCLIGGVMGLTPMIVAGGPLELAKESGFKEVTAHDLEFAGNETTGIAFGPVDEGLDDTASPLERMFIYNSVVSFEGSPDNKIHVQYQAADNRVSRTVEAKNGLLTIGNPHDETADRTRVYNNLYLLYAEETVNRSDDHAVTVKIPKDWKGTITLPVGTRVKFDGVTMTGNIVSPKQNEENPDPVLRLTMKNTQVTGNIEAKSENFSSEGLTVKGNITVSYQRDEIGSSLIKTTATNLSIKGRGNVYLLESSFDNVDINLLTGSVYGYLTGSSTDYDLSVKSTLAADFVFDRNDVRSLTGNGNREPNGRLERLANKDLADVARYDTYAAIIPKPEFMNQVIDPAHAAAEPGVSKGFQSTHHRVEDLMDGKFPKACALAFEKDNNASKALNVSTSGGFVQLGFLTDDQVIGYTRYVPGANLMKEHAEAVLAGNQVIWTPPFNVVDAMDNETFSKYEPVMAPAK